MCSRCIRASRLPSLRPCHALRLTADMCGARTALEAVPRLRSLPHPFFLFASCLRSVFIVFRLTDPVVISSVRPLDIGSAENSTRKLFFRRAEVARVRNPRENPGSKTRSHAALCFGKSKLCWTSSSSRRTRTRWSVLRTQVARWRRHCWGKEDFTTVACATSPCRGPWLRWRTSLRRLSRDNGDVPSLIPRVL